MGIEGEFMSMRRGLVSRLGLFSYYFLLVSWVRLIMEVLGMVCYPIRPFFSAISLAFPFGKFVFLVGVYRLNFICCPYYQKLF